jgi:hypothetical protein
VNVTSAILDAAIPCADSRTICARRQVITGCPESRPRSAAAAASRHHRSPAPAHDRPCPPVFCALPTAQPIPVGVPPATGQTLATALAQIDYSVRLDGPGHRSSPARIAADRASAQSRIGRGGIGRTLPVAALALQQSATFRFSGNRSTSP